MLIECDGQRKKKIDASNTLKIPLVKRIRNEIAVTAASEAVGFVESYCFFFFSKSDPGGGELAL